MNRGTKTWKRIRKYNKKAKEKRDMRIRSRKEGDK